MATHSRTPKADKTEKNSCETMIEETEVVVDEVRKGKRETNRDKKEIEKGLKAIEIQNRVLIKILIKKDIDYNSL